MKFLAAGASLLHTVSAMNFRKKFSFAMPWVLGVASLLSCAAPPAYADSWTYKLVEGSYLVDDCPVCERATIREPMRGSFDLVLLEVNPLFSRYALQNISFSAGYSNGLQYKVTGSGYYQVGGEVALVQQMTLQVAINNGFTNKLCYFTSGHQAVDRPWPMIHISVTQTNGTFTQVYSLDLAAAPLREIWFSTAGPFTAGIWQSPTNHISGGDLLSSAGRVVKRNADLTRNLGIMPIAPDVGLDAVDIIAGGEIVFSIKQDVFSETLGPLHHGDLLSNRGKVVKRNQELLAAFQPQSTSFDAGLDAVQMMSDGSILFSIATNVLAGDGTTLSPGDILNDRGEIFRSNRQLLARFHPAETNKDFGLDALYVWPSGEIWFSTEQGFQDAYLGAILAGDLLSDQGYRVYGNLELTSGFAPEDAADFGLDALFVVTDFRPLAPPPRLLGLDRLPGSGALAVGWEGQGCVFQLERAEDLSGPFLPLSPIIPDSSFNDTQPIQSQFFYRLRQW